MEVKKSTPNSDLPTNDDNKGEKVKKEEQPPKDDKIKKEETKTETKTEDVKKQEKEEKETVLTSYDEVVKTVSAKYNAKFEKLKAKYESDLKERDEYIADLLANGDNKPVKQFSIKERIAQRRAFNKW